MNLVSPQGRPSKAVKQKKTIFVGDVIQHATERESPIAGLKAGITTFV